MIPRSLQSPPCRRAASAAALLLFLALPGIAPLAAASPAASFHESIDVRLIDLEVIAQNRNGERLSGLAPADFRVLVDDRELIPRYVDEVVPGERAGDGASLLIFIDDYFALPTQRDAALNRLRNDLDAWKPGDRLAIVAYDGKKLDLLLPWTRERTAMEKALTEARRRPAYGLQRRSEAGRATSFYQRVDRASGGASVASIGFAGAGRGRRADLTPVHDMLARVERVGNASAVAARQFLEKEPAAGGRKMMLLLAGGFPADGEALAGLAAARDPILGTVVPALDGGQLFGPLLQVANRYGFAVFPIDLSQSAGASLAGSAFPGFGDSTAARAGGAELGQISSEIFGKVAQSTGGQLILGGGAGAFARLAADAESYYTLGLPGPWRGDDRDHAIRVEVRRPGAKVRVRSSFFAASALTQRDWHADELLLFQRPLDSPAGFAVVAKPSERQGFNVDLDLQLAPALLTWSPEKAGRQARLEVRVSGRDHQGDELRTSRQVIALDEPAAGRPATYSTGLKLPERPYQVLVTVYDAGSGRMLAKRLDVRP